VKVLGVSKAVTRGVMLTRRLVAHQRA
jgi:hypothetical protein